MIEEYVPHDQQNYANFSERFLDQKNWEIEQLYLATHRGLHSIPNTTIIFSSDNPTITSHKRDSVTSSDSGVNSTHVFSAILPITLVQPPQL